MNDKDGPVIVKGFLDDNESGGEIILRGILEPASLHLLLVDDYQREVLQQSKISAIMDAIMGDGVPDITLGMRGGSFKEDNGVFSLEDPCYIVDGRQRATAGIALVQKGEKPKLGAVIHFNTNKTWETRRFDQMGAAGTRLSTNVLMRNVRDTHPVVEMLHDLCLDTSFVLHNRVQWQQLANPGALLSSVSYVKFSGRLHAHLHAGRYSNWRTLARSLQELANRIGRGILRSNTVSFWEMIDAAWGIRLVSYRRGAIHLGTGFLTALCDVLSGHSNFWDDAKLDVDRETVKKLSSFPLYDPGVSALCMASGRATVLLRSYLVEHINSGRRSNRLIPRITQQNSHDSQLPQQENAAA